MTTPVSKANEYGLLIDYEFCTGCHTCEVACKKVGARSFYQRLHFEEDAIRTNYYDDPPDDAIVMTRSLCS